MFSVILKSTMSFTNTHFTLYNLSSLRVFISALEMVGPKKRMFAGVAVQLFFTAGFLLTAGFAYFIKDWRHLQIALTLPGVLFFSYYW